MKTYKFIFIAMTAFLVGVLGMQPAAQASLAEISNGDNYTTHMDDVSFYLFDFDNDGHATLNANTISVDTAALEYSLDGNIFNSFTDPVSIDFGGSEAQQFFLRLLPSGYESYLDSGNVTFMNYNEAKSQVAGHELFQALYVQWDSSPFAITMAVGDDPVTSSAPIPASALLLFTGLMGLVGFRRRMMNR